MIIHIFYCNKQYVTFWTAPHSHLCVGSIAADLLWERGVINMTSRKFWLKFITGNCKILTFKLISTNLGTVHALGMSSCVPTYAYSCTVLAALKLHLDKWCILGGKKGWKQMGTALLQSGSTGGLFLLKMTSSFPLLPAAMRNQDTGLNQSIKKKTSMWPAGFHQ